MLAILVIPRKVSPVVSTWHSDLSGLPLSNRRAYGRIVETPFKCTDAFIKRLKPILSVDANGISFGQSDSYALTLTGELGESVIVYFTRRPGQELERIDYRRRPSEVLSKNNIPSGITSVQFLSINPNSGKRTSRVYHGRYSARLFLGSRTADRISGTVITVFPDSRRSFVTGSFKARLEGLASL
ncbi:MAG: hypothetical protein WCI55_05405 [Armatimonadota bacterium]